MFCLFLEVQSLDLLNLMVHVLMAAIMFIDLLIVGHPVRLIPDLFYTTGVAFCYSIFSLTYFLLGGTDRKQNHAIYPLVDWKKQGKTLVVIMSAIFFVAVIHVLVCFLCKIKFLIHKKFFVKKIEHCKEQTQMLDDFKDFTIPSMLDHK